MLRTHVLNMRQARDTALLEASLWAAQGEGRPSESALRGVLNHLLDSPGFRGERPELLMDRLWRSAETLAPSGAEALFESLRQRLPDARNRLLAFGLMARVLVKEPALPEPDEVHLLSRFQRELGVLPLQARAMLSGLANGESPTEVASEPPTRLDARVLELMLLSEGLDACLSAAEVAALHEAREDPSQMRELCGQLLRRLAFGGAVESPHEAMRRHLEQLALVPSTLPPRREALRLGARFCEALGYNWSQELLLGFVQELFGLTDEVL